MKLSSVLSVLLVVAFTSAAPQDYHEYHESNLRKRDTWPTAKKTISVSAPITVKAGETYDGFEMNKNKWVRYDRGQKGLGDCTNIEGSTNDAVFILEDGATLKNVILGGNSIEHVHCIGDGCTVENVWWEDVCEDALTLEKSTNKDAKFYVKGGGAKNGSDKIIQHNSAGTVYITNFTVENSGKLYRSCGNCKNGYQGKRSVVMKNINAINVEALIGINTNYGDTASLSNVKATESHICKIYQGNSKGKEPKELGYQCESDYVNDCTCE